ncbi:SRPBCC domain-containing protein [Calditrichota bacterium]
MSHIEKNITLGITVPAGINDVWAAWTTEAGVKSFFSPDCKVEPIVGGAYEMYFNPDAPDGERGGEGNLILAIQKPTMLSFTWNAPPTIPTVREQRTHVTVRLRALNDNRTLVTLYHDGWGEDADWEKALAYFQYAWEKIVLPRLQYRFEHGEVDWNDPPDLSSHAK